MPLPRFAVLALLRHAILCRATMFMPPRLRERYFTPRRVCARVRDALSADECALRCSTRYVITLIDYAIDDCRPMISMPAPSR